MNKCYIIFSCSNEAESAYEAAQSLALTKGKMKRELPSSRNIDTSEEDYVLNMFADAAMEVTQRTHQAPLPRWFVAYYSTTGG